MGSAQYSHVRKLNRSGPFHGKAHAELEAFFHYRNLDVTTLKLPASYWRADLPAHPKQNAHEALSIRESIEGAVLPGAPHTGYSSFRVAAFDTDSGMEQRLDWQRLAMVITFATWPSWLLNPFIGSTLSGGVSWTLG